MDAPNRIVCPNCDTSLKAVRGVRIGRKIICPACKVGFTLKAEDAARAEENAGVNAARLILAVFGVLLFGGSGGALAYYCFTTNLASATISRAPAAPVKKDDVVDIAPAKKTVEPRKDASPLTAAEARAVDLAVADGVWFLKGRMLPEGTWAEGIPDVVSDVSIGFASLPGLTLLECGVPASDPAVQKAAALVRAQALAPGFRACGTYQRALAILFLDRLGEQPDEPLIQHMALCLIAGQHSAEGAWSYDCPDIDPKNVPQLLKMLRDQKQTLPGFRQAAIGNPDFIPAAWDNSNTQFAVLGLWVAQRHGVPVDRSIALAEKHFRGSQLGKDGDPGANVSLDGSWYYAPATNSSGWPTMTCAGLLALAIGHGVTKDPAEKKLKPLDDAAIKRAFDMLTREIDRPDEKRNPDFYFLWSLERVGVLYDQPKIGGRDWYAWGRKLLLARQQKDGSWQDGGYWGANSVLDTCFALLFLKQANLAKDLTDKLQLLAGGGPAAGAMVGKKE